MTDILHTFIAFYGIEKSSDGLIEDFIIYLTNYLIKVHNAYNLLLSAQYYSSSLRIVVHCRTQRILSYAWEITCIRNTDSSNRSPIPPRTAGR